MTIIELADKHPVMISVVSLSAVTIAAIAHRTIRLIADALTGKRTQRKRRWKTVDTQGIPKKQEHDAPVEGSILPELRAALADLGYTKREYEPILSQIDLTRPLPDIIRTAIKHLHVNRVSS